MVSLLLTNVIFITLRFFFSNELLFFAEEFGAFKMPFFIQKQYVVPFCFELMNGKIHTVFFEERKTKH